MTTVNWQIINGSNLIIITMAVLAVLVLGPTFEMLTVFAGGIIVGIYMGIISVEEANQDVDLKKKEKKEKK